MKKLLSLLAIGTIVSSSCVNVIACKQIKPNPVDTRFTKEDLKNSSSVAIAAIARNNDNYDTNQLFAKEEKDNIKISSSVLKIFGTKDSENGNTINSKMFTSDSEINYQANNNKTYTNPLSSLNDLKSLLNILSSTIQNENLSEVVKSIAQLLPTITSQFKDIINVFVSTITNISPLLKNIFSSFALYFNNPSLQSVVDGLQDIYVNNIFKGKKYFGVNDQNSVIGTVIKVMQNTDSNVSTKGILEGAFILINYLSQFTFNPNPKDSHHLFGDGSKTNQDYMETINNTTFNGFNWDNLGNLFTNILNYDKNKGVAIQQLLYVLCGSSTSLDNADKYEDWHENVFQSGVLSNNNLLGALMLSVMLYFSPDILKTLAPLLSLIHLTIEQLDGVLVNFLRNVSENRSLNYGLDIMWKVIYYAGIASSLLPANIKQILADAKSDISKLINSKNAKNFYLLKDTYISGDHTFTGHPENLHDNVSSFDKLWSGEGDDSILGLLPQLQIGGHQIYNIKQIFDLVKNPIDAATSNLPLGELLKDFQRDNDVIPMLKDIFGDIDFPSLVVKVIMPSLKTLEDPTQIANAAKIYKNSTKTSTIPKGIVPSVLTYVFTLLNNDNNGNLSDSLKKELDNNNAAVLWKILNMLGCHLNGVADKGSFFEFIDNLDTPIGSPLSKIIRVIIKAINDNQSIYDNQFAKEIAKFNLPTNIDLKNIKYNLSYGIKIYIIQLIPINNSSYYKMKISIMK